MRKILPILVANILLLSGLGAVALSEENSELYKKEIICFSEPIVIEKDNYVEIEIEESTSKLLASGKPIMPKITKTYTFPFGTKITNIEVSFSEPIEKQISKLITPTPEPQVISTIYKSKTNVESVKTYSEIQIYPEQKYSYRTGAGLKDGDHVIFLSVNAYPAQYIPSTNTILFSDTATIKIDYELPAKPVIFLDAYDFLIITSSEFTSELQPLVDYKNGDDIQTKMVTLNEIPSNGVDEQESIKLYIKDAIENWGINYVLLVGSGKEGSEKFPVRYAWIPSGNYEEKFPSDLYYADIYDVNGSFSSWDADGDGKYAEYYNEDNQPDIEAMDLYPDVYLGKIPCHTTAEVKTIVDKIINFEEHNKVLNKIVQCGGDTFSPIDGDRSGVNEGEFANAEVLTKLPGYKSIKLWGSNNQLTKQNIANGFKDGADFFDFSGHGSWGSWATHPSGLEPNGESVWIPAETLVPFSPYTGWLYVDFDIFSLNNGHKLPVVILNACSCNKYTDSLNCIGYKVLSKDNGGGIATYAASGIGYGSYGTHETQQLWGWMEVHIFEELYNTKGLGEVWANALVGYINSFELGGADLKTICEMSMFGDPTLIIEDGKDPKGRGTPTPTIFQNNLEKIISNFPRLEKLIRLLTILK